MKKKKAGFIFLTQDFAFEMFNIIYRLAGERVAKNLSKKWESYEKYQEQEEKDFFKDRKIFDKWMRERLNDKSI